MLGSPGPFLEATTRLLLTVTSGPRPLCSESSHGFCCPLLCFESQTRSLDRWWKSPDCDYRPRSRGKGNGTQLLPVPIPEAGVLPLSCPSQVPGCGDLNKCRPKRKNSSSGVPPLVMATDKILTLSLEQEQPEGLLSPLASPLHPLEVQGLICGPRFPSLPERLGPVPKQLEFQRHGSDPGLARS